MFIFFYFSFEGLFHLILLSVYQKNDAKVQLFMFLKDE